MRRSIASSRSTSARTCARTRPGATRSTPSRISRTAQDRVVEAGVPGEDDLDVAGRTELGAARRPSRCGGRQAASEDPDAVRRVLDVAQDVRGE